MKRTIFALSALVFALSNTACSEDGLDDKSCLLYTSLGCGELLLLRKKSLHWLGHLVCGGFFVAAIDETIQIFSHRGSQLQDVWLDFSGFVVGTLLLLAAVAIRRAWVNRHTR